MKIKIDDIPEGGMTIDADAQTNKWLKSLIIEIFGPEQIKDDDSGRLNLQLFRDKNNVTVIGGIILKFHTECGRCLKSFQKQQQVTIHQIMVPKYYDKKGESQTDDEDVSFYEGDEIDLEFLTKEQIILNQQMVYLCSDECKGLCQKCGKDLNKGHCKCKKADVKSSPFAVLKKIDA